MAKSQRHEKTQVQSEIRVETKSQDVFAEDTFEKRQEGTTKRLGNPLLVCVGWLVGERVHKGMNKRKSPGLELQETK